MVECSLSEIVESVLAPRFNNHGISSVPMCFETGYRQVQKPHSFLTATQRLLTITRWSNHLFRGYAQPYRIATISQLRMGMNTGLWRQSITAIISSIYRHIIGWDSSIWVQKLQKEKKYDGNVVGAVLKYDHRNCTSPVAIWRSRCLMRRGASYRGDLHSTWKSAGLVDLCRATRFR